MLARNVGRRSWAIPATAAVEKTAYTGENRAGVRRVEEREETFCFPDINTLYIFQKFIANKYSLVLASPMHVRPTSFPNGRPP
jgi:hypothetical protein